MSVLNYKLAIYLDINRRMQIVQHDLNSLKHIYIKYISRD